MFRSNKPGRKYFSLSANAVHMNQKVLKLAIPNIISNITVPLLGLVDMAMMGHLESEIYIGAIALGGVIFNFLYWMFSFLRMGTSGFTAQAYGQKNQKEIYTLFARSLSIGLLAGVVLILLQWPLAMGAFHFLEGSAEVKNLAREYFHIRIWAAPATIGLYSFTGWFIGMQNSKIPMTIAITINSLNILFSAFFVFYMKMNSAGVALGTVMAQYIGLLLALVFFYKRYHDGLSWLKKINLWDRNGLRRFLSVNSDIFIRTLCIIAIFTFFTSKSAGMSDTLLAVNSLLLQFLMFFAFFMDGFAYAAEALAGKYFGAGNREKLISLSKNVFKWGLGLGGLFFGIYLFAGESIIAFLTKHSAVRLAAKPYIIWAALVPLTSFAAFVWDGIYIGATASKGMRNSMLMATLLLFAPGYYFLSPWLENHALWLAMNLFMFGRGFFQTLLARKQVYNRL